MRKTLILWDLDGTLCRHNAAFHEQAPLAVAEAAIESGVPLSLAEAVAFARANYPGQKTAIRAFAGRYQLDSEDLFQRYYHHLQPDFLETDPVFCEAVRESPPWLLHGVLTQAPLVWIEKALTKLGLWPHFQHDWLLGHERLGRNPKSSAAAERALAQALEKGDLSPDKVVLIDDRDFILAHYASLARMRICMGPNESGDQTILSADTALQALEYVLSGTQPDGHLAT